MDKLIIAVYLNVRNMTMEEIREFMVRTRDTVSSPTNEYITMVVPVKNKDTRIECLNPKYITGDEINKKFEVGLKSIENNFEKILNEMGPYKREVLVEKTFFKKIKEKFKI